MNKQIEKWSRKYDGCIECSTTERKHVGKGKCVNCWRREWSKTEKGREVARTAFKKWSSKNKDKIAIYNKRNHEKANPDRAYKRILRGVETLRDLTKGNCRWEACNDNNPKIYASGLCRNCYMRLCKTHNFIQIKDLYGVAVV